MLDDVGLEDDDEEERKEFGDLMGEEEADREIKEACLLALISRTNVGGSMAVPARAAA